MSARPYSRAKYVIGPDGSPLTLADLPDSNTSVPRNYAEVVKWFRMAAEQGHAKAQFLLGVMYREGEGVPQHFVEAQVWFNLAAAQGHRGAKQAREIVAKRMTPDQIAEAQRMAREWLAKHQR